MNPSSCRVALAVILLSSLVFSACARETAPVAEEARPAASGGGPASPAAATGKPVNVGERMVVSEATVSIRAARPESEADAIGRYVADVGGYVVNRSAERNDDVVKNVEMIVRVPAGRCEVVLAELRRHGSVLGESVSGHDVTEDFTDTEAQLKSKRRL